MTITKIPVDKVPELHLMIVWEYGRVAEKKILADLYDNYQVLGEYQVNWDKDCFSDNLTRFYAQNLPKNSGKERHCGAGEFLLITFIDANPIYECVVTSRGSEYVNKNIFNLKEKFRQLTGGGHKIHTTNNPKETSHDLALLLGLDYEEYLQKHSGQEFVTRQTINSFAGGGSQGWESLEQLFSFMNLYLNYVVLRNFEILPDNYYAKDHGDIDFLVDDLDEAVYFMGAKKVHQKDYRVYYQICVNGEEVFIDLRHVGDNYYDIKWAAQILKNRRKLIGGFYVPCATDYLYSLIYHALIHKKRIADDYHEKISLALAEIEPDCVEELTFDYFFLRLRSFLEENSYRLERPKDKSVYFDTRYQYSNNLLNEFSLLNLQEVRPFLAEHWKNSSGSRYFQGKTASGIDVFIKSEVGWETVEREYFIAKKLSEYEIAIPRALYYRNNKGVNFVVFEKNSQFKTLNQVDRALLSDEFLEKFFDGILDMIKVLHQADIVHRDFRPANIIVGSNNEPVLIDFQFAVDSQRKKFKELKFVRSKPVRVKDLGENYARGRYRWDDAFSALIIFEEYVKKPTDKLLKVKIQLMSMVGQKEIFGIKSTLRHKFFWHVKNNLLLIKLKINLMFYKFCVILLKKEYSKKIKKNFDLLSKLQRTVV